MKIGVVTNTKGSGGMTIHFNGLISALKLSYNVIIFDERPEETIDIRNIEACDYIIRYGWRHDQFNTFQDACFTHNIKADKEKNVLIICFDATMLDFTKINEINSTYGTIIYDSSFSRQKGLQAGIISLKSLIINPPILWSPLEIVSSKSDNLKFVVVMNELLLVKGFDIILDSFLLAFTEKDKATITIKVNKKASNSPIIDEYLKKFKILNRRWQLKIIFDYISHDDMPYFFRNFDCYILASRSETFGLPALEAAFCGLAVIMHTVGGMKDYSKFINYFQVEGQIEEMPKNIWRGNKSTNWFVVDRIQLANAMREMYESKSLRKSAQITMLKEFGNFSKINLNLQKVLC